MKKAELIKENEMLKETISKLRNTVMLYSIHIKSVMNLNKKNQELEFASEKNIEQLENYRKELDEKNSELVKRNCERRGIL